MHDDLGDRMKEYENAEAGRRFMPLLPVIARIDGRAFHAFTKGMNRPYDAVFSSMMIETTKLLVEETNACIGYTQSDEISLAWHSTHSDYQIWFDGRIAKMTSQLAALASVYFNRLLYKSNSPYANRLPTFDARVWNVPNRTEGANAFVWRELDAIKNSISMAAHSIFSDRELHGKNSEQKKEMLLTRGIDWNDYPIAFKRGTYIQRRVIDKAFTAEELDRLPPLHAARTNPNLTYVRSIVMPLNMQPILSIANREDVIFEGREPILK